MTGPTTFLAQRAEVLNSLGIHLRAADGEEFRKRCLAEMPR